MSHSQSPWTTGDTGDWVSGKIHAIHAADGSLVADYVSECDLAMLVAAPELLASLQATWDALQACSDQELWSHLKPARDASLAAIAKATEPSGQAYPRSGVRR